MVKKDTRNLLVLGSIGLAGYFLLRMSGRGSGGGGFIGGGGVLGVFGRRWLCPLSGKYYW